MSKSKIEWCTDTWNPIYGCTQISPGCQNCYAKNWHDRFKDGDFSVRKAEDKKFIEPLRARKPKRYFVGSMTDIFHDDVPDKWLDCIIAAMGQTYNSHGADENGVATDYRQFHQYFVLTKRPERMNQYIKELCSLDEVQVMKRFGSLSNNLYSMSVGYTNPFHANCFFNLLFWLRAGLPGLWLGVTAENQEQADKRIPILLDTPAAHRFVSVEPMLGYVDLDYLVHDSVAIDSLAGSHGVFEPLGGKNNKLDWVICGGESGRGARFLHPDLVRKLRNQCKKTNTPFFFKQWGEHDSTGKRVGKNAAGRLLDGEEVMEWPETLKPN